MALKIRRLNNLIGFQLSFHSLGSVLRDHCVSHLEHLVALIISCHVLQCLGQTSFQAHLAHIQTVARIRIVGSGLQEPSGDVGVSSHVFLGGKQVRVFDWLESKHNGSIRALGVIRNVDKVSPADHEPAFELRVAYLHIERELDWVFSLRHVFVILHFFLLVVEEVEDLVSREGNHSFCFHALGSVGWSLLPHVDFFLCFVELPAFLVVALLNHLLESLSSQFYVLSLSLVSQSLELLLELSVIPCSCSWFL